MRRLLLTALVLFPTSAFASAGLPSVAADEVSDLFQEGVQLLRQGKDDEALDRFTRVLALDPSHETAYDLWKATDHDLWLEMLVKGGQYELVAKRLMGLAEIERQTRRDDEDAIRELVRATRDEDVLVRRRAVRELAANHGEYAVPHMLPALADPDQDERRVLTMNALTAMSGDVVLPLLAALRADDAFLRRNVALTLGYVGDARAAAALTALARGDEDEGVRLAAKEAAMKCGSMGDALSLFLQLGDDYYNARSTVLRPFDYSEVVWSWEDGALSMRGVPRYLYKDELSKAAYYDALGVEPASVDARAGLARAYASQQAEIAAREASGADVDGVAEQAAEAEIAVHAAGVEALDLALQWCVRGHDTGTGVQLAHALAALASTPTPGLRAALAAGDGALRSEAAVALGEAAYANGAAVPANVVAALAEAAGREVLRMAVLIDADVARGEGLAAAMTERGIVTARWDTGAKGLAILRRVPGVDAILVADQLPDLTVDQVLDEVAADERLAGVPVLLISSSAEAADVWGDRVTAVVAGPEGAQAVEDAMGENLGSDREQANELAARAAHALMHLGTGAGRTDLSPAVDALASTLASRPDEVTVPAMGALATAGSGAHLPALVAVLGDSGRSDQARTAAARAIGAIGVRAGGGDAATSEALGAVMSSDASLAVRNAASMALGRMGLSAEQRATLVRRARVDVSAE